MARFIALYSLCLILAFSDVKTDFIDEPNSSFMSPNLGEPYYENIDEPVTSETKEMCAGCPEKVNTDVDGISPMLDIAISDIESERDRKQLLLELIELERQVVNGIKFGITIKLASTKCPKNVEVILASCDLDETIDSEYCKVEFLQKPWLTKDKFIISNNCTSKVYDFPKESTFIREVTTQKVKQLNSEDIADIESQIIGDDFFKYSYGDEITDNNLQNDYTPLSLQTLDDNDEQKENFFYNIRRKRDLNTSEDSKSNETSSEEHLKRTVRDLNTSEDSRSNDTTSEEHTRVVRGLNTSEDSKSNDTTSEEHHRVRRDTSESSSSSSDDDDNNNGHNDDNNIRKSNLKKKESYKNDNNNGNGNNGDNNGDNDTSSSSSDDDNNNNKRSKTKRGTHKDNINEKILIRNLANFVTSSFDENDEDDFKQIAASVIKIKPESDIEGFVYHLKLKIVDSNCAETKPTHDLLTYNSRDDNCHSDLIPNTTKTCKVKIYVPITFTKPKLLSSRCHEVNNLKDLNRRFKRAGIPGGVSTVSPNDPEIISLAESTLNLLDGESEHPNKYKIVKIHKASTQVVSGSLTKITADIVISDCLKTDSKESKNCGVLKESAPKTCDIEVWNQPWLPEGKKTTVKCGGQVSKFRSKRDNSLHTSPHGVMYVLKTIPLLDEQTHFENRLKPLTVYNVIKQGNNDNTFTIRAKVGVSVCPKGTTYDILSCPLDEHFDVFHCTVLVMKDGPIGGAYDHLGYHSSDKRTVKCTNGLKLSF